MTDETPENWQELGDQFQSMVGACITEWANVDNELFQIFRDCVGPYEQCAIIYYRTPGLDIRLGLTDEIVLSVLPPKERASGGHDHPDVKAWKDAREGFSELLAVRRRIAHHPVAIRKGVIFSGTFGSAPYGAMPFGGGTMTTPSWFEIYMSQHEKVRGRGADKPPLKLEDLQTHMEGVVKLRDRLRHFFHDVLTRGRENR